MNAGNKKHTQHAPSTKTECDYLNDWIKKKKPVTYAKISPKVVNPRDIAGERKKKKKKKKTTVCTVSVTCPRPDCVSPPDVVDELVGLVGEAEGVRVPLHLQTLQPAALLGEGLHDLVHVHTALHLQEPAVGRTQHTTLGQKEMNDN